MAGPLDSLAAGIGDRGARERIAAEQAARLAASPAPAAQPASAYPYAPVPTSHLATDDFGATMYADPGAGASTIERPDWTATAAADVEEVDRQAARNLGVELGGQLLDQAAGARGKAQKYAKALLARSRSVANPQRPVVDRFVAETGAATMRSRTAADQIADAEREIAATEAAAYVDEHARLSGEAQAMQDVEQVRNEQQAAKLQQLQDANDRIREAADAFSGAPEVDPERYWKSRTGFQRFAGVLGAAAYGAAGWSPEQATSHIRLAVDRDIDAQRFNADLRGRKFEARRAVLDAGERVFERMREHFGDSRAAEHAIRAARFEEAKARVAAMRAARGLPLMDAQHAALVAELDKAAASERYQLATLVNRTPQRLGGGLAVRGGARKTLEDLMKHEQQRELKLTNEGASVAGKALEMEAEQRSRQAERDQRSADRANTTLAENKRFIAKETADAQRVRDLAQDLLDDIDRNGGDVPGVASVHIPFVGAPTHTLTAAARDFDRRLNALKEYDITDLTGAVAGEDQKLVIQSFLAGNEESIASGLREIQRAMDARITQIEAADPKAAAEIRTFRSTPNLGGFRGARVDAPAGASSVVDEDP